MKRLFAALGVFVLFTTFVVQMTREEVQTRLTPEPMDPRPGQVDCPAGESTDGLGPDMHLLPEGFCIDTTEVTRAQYQAWLETSPGGSDHPACGADESLEPGCEWPPSDAQAALPVVCVDWCDAAAFCRAAGKRLCGSVSEGEYDPDDYDDPEVSEWFAACTSGGRYEYTYGNDIDRARCRGGDAEDFMQWGLVDVGSLSGCESTDEAYGGVHDLSGNAAEWDGACENDDVDAPCRIRGGSYEHQHHGLRCAMGRNLGWPRGRQHPAVGFRCCAAAL